MESPDGQGSGELVELEVGAVEEARPEETSTGEGENQGENSEQALAEPVKDELENKVSADDEAAWTSYKDIMEETGPPVTLTTLSEITPADNGEEDGLPDSSLPLGAKIQVWVSNPKQVEDVNKMGIKSSYTSYFVRCQTTLKSYPYTQRSVWRRFKDFEALHSLLRANHPGYFCPPLPNKSYIGAKRAKEDFVRARQLDLQKFLRQITSHASLVEAEEVKLFLGIPEELNLSHEWLDVLESVKKPDSQLEKGKLNGASTALKQDIKRTMRKVGESFKKEVLKKNRPISENERRLRQTTAWMRALEVELGACCHKARALVGAYEVMTTEMLHLGRSFIALARYEEESGHKCGRYTEMGNEAVSRAGSMQKTGYASLRVHHFYRKFAAITSQWLMTLEDHLNMVPAALDGLNDQEKAQDRIHDCEDELEGTRQRLAELTRDSSKRLGASSSSMKSAQLSLQINALVGNLGTLAAEYDRVREINEKETQLLTAQRHQSFHAMVKGLAKDQAELYESIAAAWTALGEQLRKEPVE